MTGKVLLVIGGTITAFEKWSPSATITKEGRWTIDEIASELPKVLG